MKIADGHPINLPALLETRMLVQANSGGGKSWVLRRLLEQTATSVQQLVIDPEGEFSTLREKFDYVIAAPHDGDALATPATASLLARRLLESGVSAILDIYDLKAHERSSFVRRFIEALINAPKTLWHPVLIVLDEAHVYAPQTGSADSMGAVIDIATRGRKRGQCLVAATQRLSKLHKDVAAELGNKMIGRTGLDIDVKRAADELGLASREATESLRNLQPGEFYIFGPALSRTIERIRVGHVATTHPKAGHRLMAAPPAPSAKLRQQLAKLVDLQKDAEHEARTIEELKADNAKLRRETTIANKRAERAGVPEIEVAQRIRAAIEAHRREHPTATLVNDGAERKALQRIAEIIGKILHAGGAIAPMPRQAHAQVPLPMRTDSVKVTPTDGLSSAQQRILDTLAQLEAFGIGNAEKAMVAAHSGASPTSGGYFNNLGRMRTMGLLDYPSPGQIAMTDAGRAKANPPAKALTVEDLHESWYRFLPTAQALILREVIAQYPNAIGKDVLADAVGVSRTSGGYFNNLGRLRTLGAIDYPSPGMVVAKALLFPTLGAKR